MITGINHVSMKCHGSEELKKVLAFYVDLLGIKIARIWDKDKNPIGLDEYTNRMDEIEGLMLDTGNGKIEIFTNLDYEPDTGIIRHFALDVDDAEMYAQKCKATGYEIFMGPKDINLGGQKAKIAFCFGPLKEQIEFYQMC